MGGAEKAKYECGWGLRVALVGRSSSRLLQRYRPGDERGCTFLHLSFILYASIISFIL